MSTVTDRPAGPGGIDERLHQALSSTTRPQRPSALSQCLTFAWRAMLKIKHVPEQLLDVTITPVLFLLMFTYLFGGATEGSTDKYLQYLLPGMLVQTVLFTSVYSGVTQNTDVTKGVVDRFRSLPIWGASPLMGAVLGDAVRYLIAGCVVMALGVVMGFDLEGGVLGLLAALALVIVFAFGLSWVFTTLGLILRAPNAVMNAGFMGLFPLIFLSNIFVRPETLPSALEWFVGVNPVSLLTTAERGLLAGNPDAGDILLVIAIAAAITALFAPLTAKLYRDHA